MESNIVEQPKNKDPQTGDLVLMVIPGSTPVLGMIKSKPPKGSYGYLIEWYYKDNTVVYAYDMEDTLMMVDHYEYYSTIIEDPDLLNVNN